MARPARSTSLARPRPIVAGTVVRPWRDIPAVVTATESILRTHAATGRATTKAVLAIGRQIAKVRAQLPEGEFVRWAREGVPFDVRTAQNYLGLAAWAESEPETVKSLAHLGPSKLYRIAALPPARRRKFVPGVMLRIPGGPKKTLELATVAELDRAIGGLIPAAPPPAVDKIVVAYRHRVASLGALTDQLVAHAAEVDPHVAHELLAEVQAIAHALDDAFGE
jgi:hypothetical protein